MNDRVDFAIFSAIPEELNFFHQTLSDCKSEIIFTDGFEFKVYHYQNRKILLSATGIGTTFAAAVLMLVHARFQPHNYFFTGTAGGIDPRLKLTDAVIVERAFEAELQNIFTLFKDTPFESCLLHPLKKKTLPQFYVADSDLLAITKSIDSPDVTVYRGTAVSSNNFPTPLELFGKIKSEKPFCIDMETSAFYQIAWLLNAKALAVRGISNLIDCTGRDENVHASDLHSAANSAAKVLFSLIRVMSSSREVSDLPCHL